MGYGVCVRSAKFPRQYPRITIEPDEYAQPFAIIIDRARRRVSDLRLFYSIDFIKQCLNRSAQKVFIDSSKSYPSNTSNDSFSGTDSDVRCLLEFVEFIVFTTIHK